MSDKYEDFYQKFRNRIKNKSLEHSSFDTIREYLLIAPDLLHLLIKLIKAPEISVVDKAKLIGGIVYFISPVDLIPEIIFGLAGYIDDIIVAAIILNPIIERYPDVVNREWAGEEDVLSVVRDIIHKADTLVGRKILRKILKIFGK